MKRNVLIGIIGLASAASVFSQGHILISNYLVPPYNQVVWSPGSINPQPVNDDSAMIQIWFGEGELTDMALLQPGKSFFVNPALNYNGGGYFDGQLQNLPTWQPGDVFTFQLRLYWPKPAYDDLLYWSVLWTEQQQIVGVSEEAQLASTVPQINRVPEPSPLALAGVGLGAALLGLSRRKMSSGA